MNELTNIPSYLKVRKDKCLLNKYKIESIPSSTNDITVVIYYINKSKIQILLRNLSSENGWNNDIQIILTNLNIYAPNKTYRISCGSSDYNFKKINININDINFLIDYQKEYEQLIPKKIIQTYETNKYHNIYHYNAVQTFIELNPEYEYFFYNDEECFTFIKKNFDQDVINAYQSLIPKAFKADLFRYCFIYIQGGCYFDNKYILRKPLRQFIKNNDNNVFCLDRYPKLMFNSIIISIPRQDYLKNIINQIVFHVKQKYYGESPLHPTGPRLFYDYVKNENVKLKHYSKKPTNEYLNSFVSSINDPNDIYLHKFYKGYYHKDTNVRFINYRNSKGSDYTQLWNDRKIYS
jgi:mannosyltransferase OCH1-like enzyme